MTDDETNAIEAFKLKFEKEIETFPFTVIGAAFHEGVLFACAKHRLYEDYQHEIDALRARSAKLLEALESISKWQIHDGIYTQEANRARDALAEYSKGESGK